MGVADFTGQPAVFKPNKWPISPKYAINLKKRGINHIEKSKTEPIVDVIEMIIVAIF